MPENKEIVYCPYRGVNLTPREVYRCTQGLCSVKNLDCSLIITPAQNSAKCTESGLPYDPNDDYIEHLRESSQLPFAPTQTKCTESRITPRDAAMFDFLAETICNHGPVQMQGFDGPVMVHHGKIVGKA